MPLAAETHAPLFEHGNGRAVQLPPEFECSSEEVLIRQDGRRLVIEPMPTLSLLDALAQLEPLADDFPRIDEPALDAVEF